MDFLNKIPDWLGAGLLAALTGAIGWYAPRHWFPGGSPTTPQQGQSPADDAQRLLHSLQIALDLSPGSYVVNESTDHNAVTANRLFTNAHGEIIGTFGTSWNITSRKEAELHHGDKRIVRMPAGF